MDMSVPHTQAEIEAWVSQQAQQARAEDDTKGFLSRVGAGAQAQAGAQSEMADSPIGAFVRHVPQNVTGGVLDAALATADKLNTLDQWLATPADVAAHNAVHPEQPVETEKQLPGIVPQEDLDALRAWRESVRPNGENMGDTVAQGIAQFAVPFTAFAKVFGLSTKMGLLSNIGRAAGADIAATTVAMPSHSARGSTELLELGRKAETNFGAVLREVAPDDGLITRYINWMNDTTNESTLEGEFKNSIDTLSLSGATAGLIKSAATTFKAARGLTGAALSELGGAGPVGAGAQRGSVTLGTPSPQYLYRGVSPGVNPLEPRNRAGALFYTPKQAEAHDYGALVHRADAPSSAFNAGSLPDFLKSQGIDPARAGHQDALMEALSNYAATPGASEWLRFSYPLPGNPEEFVRFPALAPKK